MLRIIRAVAVTSASRTGILLGAFNLHGEVVPVVNLRLRLKLPTREIRLTDLFIIVRTSRRFLALPADSVEGVVALEDDGFMLFNGGESEMHWIAGFAKLSNGLAVVQDLEKFLSLEEEKEIAECTG